MKRVSKVINIILYVLLIFTVSASFGSTVLKQPFIMSAVRSNSMYPLFQKGDIILVNKINNQDKINIGDIVVFRCNEGSLLSKGWVVHRIISGDSNKGYITKGDANRNADQISLDTPPIKRQWIVSKVITFNKVPLKISYIGYVPLYMEKMLNNSYLLPLIIIALSIILVYTELLNNKKRRKKNKFKKHNMAIIYILIGITISIMLGASMLISSAHINLRYKVSDENSGVMMGSNVGIIKKGDLIEKKLTNISNKGFVPLVSIISTKDPQISFSQDLISVKASDEVDINFKLKAENVGNYNSSVWIGLFYPLIPKKAIYLLSKKNYWYSLIIISIIPGLPFILYPFIDRKLRKKLIKSFRKSKRKLIKLIPFHN